jgi:hypothetical protein
VTSDLQQLRDLGQRLDPSADQPPADLRRRVMTTALAARDRTGLQRLRGWRLAWLGAAAAAVAVAVVAQTAPIAVNAPPPSAPPPPTTAAPVNVITLLELAAEQVSNGPQLRARANQFIFVESINTHRVPVIPDEIRNNPDALRRLLGPVLDQEWRSVDGTRTGLVRSRLLNANSRWQSGPIPGCRDGKAPGANDRPDVVVSCTPDPGYRADLPTTADAMLRYLYRPEGKGTDVVAPEWTSKDQLAFDRVAYVLFLGAVSPAVHAAAFRAAAHIPGVSVVADVVDLTGRHGVAITRTDRGVRAELIFDRDTFRYLGVNRTVVGPTPSVDLGPWIAVYPEKQAILRVAIVDRVGQLP